MNAHLLTNTVCSHAWLIPFGNTIELCNVWSHQGFLGHTKGSSIFGHTYRSSAGVVAGHIHG